MGGQDSSPNEPSKAYVQSVGRGGVGNLQYAKKFEGMADEAPATRVDHDHLNQLHSTGRGGTGNFKVGSDETSVEKEYRLSTTAKNPNSSAGSGRGGAGNIGAVKAMQRKEEEEQARKEARKQALIAQRAKAEAQAAAESIQVPKPTRSM